MAKILYIEDELVLGRLIKEGLEKKSYEVCWEKDGNAGWNAFETFKPDICVVDIMLPSIDGFDLAKKIRYANSSIPILFLTARSSVNDVVKGFESGGNDYLKKPFSIEELAIRIRELLKRHNGVLSSLEHERYSIGNFIYHHTVQTLENGKISYNLSSKEADLLKELAINKNEVIDRKVTLLKLWGDDNFFNARTMDVYISKLRKYLQEDANIKILNVRGKGYKLIEKNRG